MTDLHERFGRLDDLQAPDLWSEIAARSPGSSTTVGPVAVSWRGTTGRKDMDVRHRRRAGRARSVLLAAAILILALIAAAAIYVGTRPTSRVVTNGPITLARGGDLVSVDPVAGTLDRADALLGCEGDCPEISSVAWSPDGTRLAYASDGFLWVRDTVIDQSRRLTACCTSDVWQSPGPEPMAIDWSPDGSSLVFSLNGDLWTTAADGSNLRLVVAPDNGAAGQPSWLEDGRIGFSLDENEEYSIAVHDLDSGATRTVVTGDGPYWAPAWSPDGTRIAYFTGAIGTRLTSIRTDGSDPITLLEVPLCCTVTIPAAEWSPDGQLLAVVIQDLLLVEPDGSGFRRLEHGVAADRPAWQPVWIPADERSRPGFDTPGAVVPVVRPPASDLPSAILSADVDMGALAELDLDTGKLLSFDAVGADLQLSSGTPTERYFSHYAEQSLAHVLVAGGANAGLLGPTGCAEALDDRQDIGIVLLDETAVSLAALTPQSHLCAITDQGNIAEFWPVDHSALHDPLLTVHVEVWTQQ